MNGASSRRIASVDALRGLAVAAMLLVNNPGDWGTVYWPLEHSAWHGCTPTDLIFPFFLFIVGVSAALALGPRADAGAGCQGCQANVAAAWRGGCARRAEGATCGGVRYAPVAQLDRASAFEAECRKFESYRACRYRVLRAAVR